MHMDRCAFGLTDFGSEWWSLAFVSALDAGGFLVQGWCSNYRQRPSPLPLIHAYLHSCVHILVLREFSGHADVTCAYKGNLASGGMCVCSQGRRRSGIPPPV